MTAGRSRTAEARPATAPLYGTAIGGGTQKGMRYGTAPREGVRPPCVLVTCPNRGDPGP